MVEWAALADQAQADHRVARVDLVADRVDQVDQVAAPEAQAGRVVEVADRPAAVVDRPAAVVDRAAAAVDRVVDPAAARAVEAVARRVDQAEAADVQRSENETGCTIVHPVFISMHLSGHQAVTANPAFVSRCRIS